MIKRCTLLCQLYVPDTLTTHALYIVLDTGESTISQRGRRERSSQGFADEDNLIYQLRGRHGIAANALPSFWVGAGSTTTERVAPWYLNISCQIARDDQPTELRRPRRRRVVGTGSRQSRQPIHWSGTTRSNGRLPAPLGASPGGRTFRGSTPDNVSPCGLLSPRASRPPPKSNSTLL